MPTNLSDLVLSAQTDDLLIDNRYTVTTDRPLVYGSPSSIDIPGNSGSEAFQIPSYGFFTGSAETLTLEFWLQIDQVDQLQTEQKDVLANSVTLIQFSEHASLRIYRNYLLLVWKTYYRTCPIQYFNYPMLIDIGYTKRAGEMIITLVIDGKTMLQFNIEANDIDIQTRYITFSNGSLNYRIKYGPIVMYPYIVNNELAIKHYIYGQGVKVPTTVKNFMADGIVEASASYSEKQITKVEVPSIYGWENFEIYNLKYDKGNVKFDNYALPQYVEINVTNSVVPYYKFNSGREYFSGFPLGIGIESNMPTEMGPDVKYVLFSISAADNFLVCYLYEGHLKVDCRVDNLYAEALIDIVPDNYIDFSILFNNFYTQIWYSVEKIFNSDKMSVHIGYLEERLQSNDGFLVDGIPTMPFYYNAIEDPEALPFKVKFLHKIMDQDPYVENGSPYSLNHYNGAVTYQHYERGWGNIFQTGILAKIIPLSTLTHFVKVPNYTGNTTIQEKLEYLQFNIDTTEDVQLRCRFFDVTLSSEVTGVTNELIFNSWDELYGQVVTIANNGIIKLPATDNYDSIMMEVVVHISSNMTHNQTRLLNLNKLRIAGFAHKHEGVTTFDTINGASITPFSRTDSMIFPAFNSDVQLLLPSLDRSFYTLSELSSFYLVEDELYDDLVWDHGFLIQQSLPRVKTDKVYGYTFFFKHDINLGRKLSEDWNKRFGMVRINPQDGSAINHLSRIDVERKTNHTFVLHTVIQDSNIVDIYINGKLYVPGIIPLSCNEWYNITVLYRTPISLAEAQTVYLEFLAPSIYYTNIGLISLNDNSEFGLLARILISNQQFANFIYNIFIGNTRQGFSSADVQGYWPILQSAWISIYMNVVWNKEALQYEDVV